MDASTIVNAALLLFIVVGLWLARYIEQINQVSQQKLRQVKAHSREYG